MSHLAPHRLADLARGRLTGGAARRANRHLDGCAACQQALAGTAQVKSGRRVAGGRLRTVCCPSWHAKPAARRSLPFDDVAPFQRQEKLPLQPFRWLRGQGYAAAESAA